MYTIRLPEGRAGEARERNIQQKSTFAYFFNPYPNEERTLLGLFRAVKFSEFPALSLLRFSSSLFVSSVSCFSTPAAPPSAYSAFVFICL
jgi:hypothetical protein